MMPEKSKAGDDMAEGSNQFAFKKALGTQSEAKQQPGFALSQLIPSSNGN